MKGLIDTKVWIALMVSFVLLLVAGIYMLIFYNKPVFSPEEQTGSCIKICESPTESRDDLQFLRCVPQLQQDSENVCSASCIGFLNDQSTNPGQTAPAGTACELVDCFCE